MASSSYPLLLAPLFLALIAGAGLGFYVGLKVMFHVMADRAFEAMKAAGLQGPFLQQFSWQMGVLDIYRRTRAMREGNLEGLLKRHGIEASISRAILEEWKQLV